LPNAPSLRATPQTTGDLLDGLRATVSTGAAAAFPTSDENHLRGVREDVHTEAPEQRQVLRCGL
jgi:hypothetical protein